MKLRQLSVRMENVPGRLHEVTAALAAAQVNLRAMMLADTADFGVQRLLVPDVPRARRVLMEMHLPAHVEEVIAFEVEDRPGSLAQVLEPLLTGRINVEYMYAFTESAGQRACLVFRFSDNDRALRILQEAGVPLTDAETLAGEGAS